MQSIPSAKGHWLFGCAAAFAREPHLFPARLGWRQGGLARFRILHRPMLVVTNPEYAHHILVTAHAHYQRSFQYRSHRATIGEGLLSTDGTTWLKRRRQIAPTFRQEAIRYLVTTTCEVATALMDRWAVPSHQGQPIAIGTEMQRFALTVSGKALLSTDISCDKAILFSQAVRDSLSLTRQRNTAWFQLPLSVPTTAHRRLHQTRVALDTFILPFIQERLAGQAPPSLDLLQALMQSRDPETQAPLSPEALLDETKTLFVTGFETTATALTWTLYLLACHPEVAERWQAEIDYCLKGQFPGWDDLPKLRYTQQILSESMRLYPPVYNLARECIQPDEIAGYSIPKGILILISVYGIHRQADWWPDPHAFRPERFAEDACWNKFAYLPFAMGKHTCIGNHFALMTMTIALALIGQRYRLQLLNKDPVEPRAQITLVPAEEILMQLVPRHD
jgi:cytochrome P450